MCIRDRFYYAGHGVHLHGVDAMVPVGADPATEADAAAQLVDLAGVLKSLDAAPTKLNLVILDASRANPLRPSLRGADGGFTELQPPRRTVLSSAARPGRVAREGENGISPFTRALARQMLRPDLDVLRVFQETDLAVKRATGGDQEIWVASSAVDRDLPFTFVEPMVPAPPRRGLFSEPQRPASSPPPSMQSNVFPTPHLPPTPPPVPPAQIPADVARNSALLTPHPPANVLPPAPPPPPASAAVAATSGAVLYDEDPSVPQGHRYEGRVTWRTEPDGGGIAVRAVAEVPERGLTMTLLLRRNADPALPATHTADIRFTLPADVGGGGVDNVPGLLMKLKETTRGAPLSALAVKVAASVFLVGLSNRQVDVAKNLDLLRSREWIDIPIVYANQRRAILAIAKGADGNSAFTTAFAAWGDPPPAAAPPAPPAPPPVPPPPQREPLLDVPAPGGRR